jgi:lysophospholipase L1-like esterase
MIVRYKFPQSPDTELNPILDQYVDAMRSVAKFLNRPLVDMSRILKTVGKVGPEKESLIRNQANSGVIDGAHLTAEGYRLLAVTVYQALLDNHLAGRRIVCFGDSITHGYPLAGMGTLEGDNYPAVLSRLLNQDCGEEE